MSISPDFIAFVWASIGSGVVYDLLKSEIGVITDNLISFKQKGKDKEFKKELESICSENPIILEKISQIMKNEGSISLNNSGSISVGHNIIVGKGNNING